MGEMRVRLRRIGAANAYAIYKKKSQIILAFTKFQPGETKAFSRFWFEENYFPKKYR